MRVWGGFAAVAAVLVLAACAELQGGLDQVLGSGGRPLDASTVASGIREALRVGTERAVEETSRAGGFLDTALRIPLPEEFETAGRVLRAAGLGSRVDELEVAMNRAAERAAGEAAPVFWNAIRAMTIEDALQILNGGETAATEYFRARTSDELRTRFQPIVNQKMEEVGLYRLYREVQARAALLPLAPGLSLDLDGYVTDRGLDGLFTVLASEERKIRQDPAARTTELLRRVFGAR